MIAGYATTLLVGALSAVLPVTPVEPYVIAVVTTTGDAAWLVGTVAGAGQTAGELIVFLAVRGTLRSVWIRGRLTRAEGASRSATPAPPGRFRRWTTAATARLDRPRQAAAVLFTSAVTGLPPLLLTSAYAARTPMSAAVFSATCLTGRTIRFTLVASAPGLLHALHLV
ncbi:hypothetical protein [Actinacidiphila bryophytorum]|uniref:VTT domain-containing protein n=1 Tax=Actinacidiphila bryophytorum TaxID=1436133 RepID=A0A9W4H7V3_9ACTN|nr:hypothetical protein [Actinacidiphila bryophytorum]MBM9437741.1 hypothetical protein [Actinacidiphila bryophytorum]MBN6545913.1 hypothetical protein [Actinacidiphila bryophytorum]CAG7656798.1 conserved membrane hypothetical protein [Actinacidiphila bryophytorum]